MRGHSTHRANGSSSGSIGTSMNFHYLKRTQEENEKIKKRKTQIMKCKNCINNVNGWCEDFKNWCYLSDINICNYKVEDK